MMTEEAVKELDPQMVSVLAELIQLAGLPVPDTITPQSVQSAIASIKTRLAQAPNKGKKQLASRREKNVLVVGFVGIINHQLKQILSRAGATVEVADDAKLAMEVYQETDIDFAIVDISSPHEKAGLQIIEEIKRLAIVCNMQTHILVLGQPSKSNAMEKSSKAVGATSYVEKGDNWQAQVLEQYLQ